MARHARNRVATVRGTRRRRDAHRSHLFPLIDPRVLMQRPEFVPTLAVMLVFVLLGSFLTIASREEVRTYVGQVMDDTRHNRVTFSVADDEATERQREEARRESPLIYRVNQSYLDRLEAALRGLPRAVANREDLEGISQSLRRSFNLTTERLQAIQPHIIDGEPTEQWDRWVDRFLHQELIETPLIGSDDYQQFATTLNRQLIDAEGREQPLRADALELRLDRLDELRPRLAAAAETAGFPEGVAPTIVARILDEPNPTVVFDSDATEEWADQAAAEVETVYVEHREGEVIYQRGEILSAEQYEQMIREREAFYEMASIWEIWPTRLGIIGAMTLFAILMVGYIGGYCPRITANPMRLIALVVLMCGMLAIAAGIGVNAPRVMMLGAVSSTLFLAIITLLAYDERLALWLSMIQAILVSVALEMSPVTTLLLFSGCALMIVQLHEVRHRNALIRAAAVTAVAIGAGAVLLGLLRMPLVFPTALDQLLLRGVWSASGALIVGFVVLGVLPSLERWFDITTGMTLAELRDTKQPLLRMLQQKAPGTYNHSLQVANIAEAAAESIGANGLLTYVGALYHDIGKMNKPAYFVENQADGYNKHQKLSPAMSLLVIVGHVKDGMEIAREYGLPRKIQHFIESHHGTTLVQYFYHAAKSKAEADDRSPVMETEFRYPGPKPKTKEAAILLLVDCVESATRAMADPNPSRIENLVRKFSRERLADGQFDQCDLTFRELSQIEESIIKSMCAIYHGRISYPSSKPAAPAPPVTAQQADQHQAETEQPATA